MDERTDRITIASTRLTLRAVTRKMHTLWSLTLRQISKISVTRRQILRFKCTKFDFRWALPLAVFKEAYF